jgi:hypothetical protein
MFAISRRSLLFWLEKVHDRGRRPLPSPAQRRRFFLVEQIGYLLKCLARLSETQYLGNEHSLKLRSVGAFPPYFLPFKPEYLFFKDVDARLDLNRPGFSVEF